MQNEPTPTPTANDAPNRATDYDWLFGIALLLLLHLIQIPLIAVTVGLALMAVGITQLIYVIPFVFYFKKKGRPGIAKGLMIGAAITFLLNGTCTVLFFSDSNNFH